MLQTRILRKRLYQINTIDEIDYSKIVWERKEKLDKIEILLSEGCSELVAFQTLNISRPTYFRWKKNYKNFGLMGLENESKRPVNLRKNKYSNTIVQRIYHLRKKFPLWGKAKITIKYNQEYEEKISQSTVGRIITKLCTSGKIMPVRFLYGKKESKRRIFNGHAQRWKFGMKAQKIGELIQVDHMTITIPGLGQVKHFTAVCPITKFAVYQLYQEATSKNAFDFFEYMKKEFPFPILSIQVDGGGEFMADFEKATCKDNIPLFVLPPRSPEFNGTVERGNGTAKYEFYAQYDGPASLHIVRKNLKKFAFYYNNIRPHQGIDLLTPCQFFEVIKKEAHKSHML